MRARVLKFVLFSIIICSFEYVQNELYFIYERNICLERNVPNFRNNRILADPDNYFDLNDFYQSTFSLVNQLNDCNDDDEEITNLRNMIDSHIKKDNEGNILLDLNNVDRKAKKLIHKLRNELEKVKKEIDNIRNGELETQPVQNKRITIKNENNSVSEHEDFNELENYETAWEDEYDDFEDEYNEITSSNSYKEIKINEKIKITGRKYVVESVAYIIACFTFLGAGGIYVALLHIPYIVSLITKLYKLVKMELKRTIYK
ncbi:fam-b protein [Plasmodium vinckei]|uniref:Fam-b protein n=1 Tax=Plasmodium vinckei TaxID=5860 RepID=A0A6V7STJ8_PLAVN|nr:fam-b protein [Plasmodium vinckei]